jgi:hypothetical protein
VAGDKETKEMAKNRMVIWKNPDTEETEIFINEAVARALDAAQAEIYLVEEDAFGDLSASEVHTQKWSALPAKVKKAINEVTP